MRALAELIDRPADELAEITTANARRAYGLAVGVKSRLSAIGPGVALPRPVRYRLVIERWGPWWAFCLC